ncbi:MAG: SpoIIE family protein phosphatase [Spirochaetales bacterium]|nr:SpoIIE family protein phosphatase [Spirochaetales bacterium]
MGPGRLFILLIFILVKSASGQSLPVQIWEDASQVVSLDAVAEKHGWWATAADLDPVAFSRQLLLSGAQEKENYPGFVPSSVPQDLNELKLTPNPFHESASAWQLKTFIAPAGMKLPVAIRLGIITDRDRTYLNGVLIGETGDWEAELPQAYDRIRLYSVPEGVIRPGALNVILIHSKRYFPDNIGLYRDTARIGPAMQVYTEYYKDIIIQLVLLAAYLTAGGYFLFLFARRRKERQNLFFGTFVLFLVIYQFMRNQIKYELPLSFIAMKRAEYFVLFLVLPLFYYFLRSYFALQPGRFLKWWDRFILGLTGVFVGLAVFILFSSDAILWNEINKTVVQPLWLIYIVAVLTLLIHRLIQKDRDAFYIVGGFSVILLAMVVDTFGERGYYNFPRVMGYAFIVFIMSLALILANHFVRLNEEVEDLNRNLELKVEERTNQLRKTLAEVQELKIQQDGDYFLTSLLIKPLSGNFGKTKNVSVDILVRQKKRFVFKKWESEIGGDICATDAIQLRGRDYTVFVNGDAMGKSIQGAGGALVLGTVFKSILARTQQSFVARNKHPEQWLKDAFIEFQNIFVSFDGTMLMSAVMGLVDDATGFLYFINAEHPWVVLYRDGRASFIERELLFRKLGIMETGGSIRIQTFQMERDDVILIGSDGRDDILLGMEDGMRVINEDEQEFLRRTEEGRGMLAEIEEALYKKGSLTDDFTLIRIAYKEDHPLERKEIPVAYREALAAARRLYREGKVTESVEEYRKALAVQEEAEALHELGQIYIKQKDYSNAARTIERYLDLNPADTEFLYWLSLAQKHSRELSAAADTGERCRLRSPEHRRNLLNLADVYRLLENPERATMLLDLCRKLEPGDPNIGRLEEALARSGKRDAALID